MATRTAGEEGRARRSRILMWLGIAIYVVGSYWDARWHETHPEAIEAGWAMLEAHGIMYLGTLVVLLGAAYAFLQRSRTRPSLVSWYGLAAAGAGLHLGGSAWDAWAHAAGHHPGLAHLAASLGMVAMLIGVIAASVVASIAGTQARG